MMDADTDTDYSESAYAAMSDSDLSKEKCKPCGCDRKSKPRHGRREKDKRGAKKQHKKNPCPHCKKFHRTKPHRVSEDKCMWNKKYKGYWFKTICDEQEVAFKPCHKFTADLGGYAKWDSDGLGSEWSGAGMPNARENDESEWIQVKYKNSPKTKYVLP